MLKHAWVTTDQHWPTDLSRSQTAMRKMFRVKIRAHMIAIKAVNRMQGLLATRVSERAKKLEEWRRLAGANADSPKVREYMESTYPRM